MVPPPRLRLPRPPEAPAPYRFPVIAALAPVVISLVLWLVTGSAFALLFAAMGPVAAVAGWIDSKLTNRRSRARQSALFETEVDEALVEIVRVHDRERVHLRELTPDAVELVMRRGSDPSRWRGDAASPVIITPGVGTLPSTIETEPVADSTDARVASILRELVETASHVESAPIPIDARLGIGVIGPAALALSVARALAVQVAWCLSPANHWWAADNTDELEWLMELPHDRRTITTTGSFIEFGGEGSDAPALVIAVAGASEMLPRSCRVVIAVGAGISTIASHPSASARGPLQPGVVTRQHALAWARDQCVQARREGLAGATGRLPDEVALSELFHPPAEFETGSATQRSLAATIAVGVDGPLTVDLVAEGPHAVVGGTTGSGKSELLTSWILAMAASRPPADVTFLLIDFKGGSAFAPLKSLPHTVGIVTDLDSSGATRARESLKAEVQYRERLLLREGVRSIEETSSAPRLVIVVDEYAAMVSEHPDLHSLFSDLAARGRSLGVHLILCTQRPSGVVRDGVLANIDLRISLRVNNRSDSSAVVGTEDAAAIPATARGRAVVRRATGDPMTVQVARATDEDTAAIVARWASAPSVRKVWCDPLPVSLGITELDTTPVLARDGGIGFGITDLPREQRREVAVYTPATDGHLLVLGAGGSGKSNFVDLLATSVPNAVLVPAGIDGAWDVVDELAEQLDGYTDATTAAARLVLIDDLDSLVPRFAGEYRQAFVEMMNRVLRDGPARGIHVVITGQRLSGDLQSIVTSMQSRIMLRHTSRHDLVLAGGEADQFVESLPPGAGHWRGYRIQIAKVQRVDRQPVGGREVALDTNRALALVSTQSHLHLRRVPGAIALANANLDSDVATSPGSVIVGDVDDWQSRWGALTSLRSRAEIVFDRCIPADFRALTRSRTLPPPVIQGQCWVLTDEGAVKRTRLPW